MSTQAEHRRQIGIDSKKARQASGRAMRDDLRALSGSPRIREPLPVVPKRGKAGAVRGVSSAVREGQSGGRGISGEITEVGRESGPAIIVLPEGGFFAYLVLPVKSITFEDEQGLELKMNLQPPSYDAFPPSEPEP